MANKTVPRSTSWGLIFFMLLFFFPVGIPLLIIKVTTEKFAYAKNGKILSIFGWIFIGLGIFYLILGLSGLNAENVSDTIVTLIIILFFFVGAGTALVFSGKRFKRRAAKFSRYIAIINSLDEYSLDGIADAFPASYDQVCKDLQSMLDAGYFLNSYLDLQRKELIVPKLKNPGNYVVNAPMRSKIIECSGCGATNVIQNGKIGKCEYCGLPLC